MTPYWSDDHLTLYGGDCRTVLAELPAESVHCVVTSPPYWGLRDYGTATWDGGDPEHAHDVRRWEGPKQTQGAQSGHASEADRLARTSCSCGARRIDSQLGLEPAPEEYVANMVAVFREVRRVLRKDGTLWLNLGDSYANPPPSGTAGQWNADKQGDGHALEAVKGQRLIGGTAGASGLAPKNLVGIPWRVAFALQADGWYLRSDIIWAKPNPMPESVTDRPTKAHEYLFLLSKSPRYYYDADAVREGVSENTHSRGNGIGVKNAGTEFGQGIKHNSDYASAINGPVSARNLRTVWNIATEPYPGAHFATFPRKLVEPCVKAGTSERGVCPECGAPWVRVVEPNPEYAVWAKTQRFYGEGGNGSAFREAGTNSATAPVKGTTTGWRATCDHLEPETLDESGEPYAPLLRPPVPAVVLDPFAGSGTTLLVAQALGRRGIGIDLSPDYLKQALARNAQTPLGLVG